MAKEGVSHLCRAQLRLRVGLACAEYARRHSELDESIHKHVSIGTLYEPRSRVEIVAIIELPGRGAGGKGSPSEAVIDSDCS